MSDKQQVCSFMVDRYLFGIASHRVQEVMRYKPMTHVPLSPPHVRGLINLRGQIVTAIDLRRCLDFGDHERGWDPMNVVVYSDDSLVSLLVDEVRDVLEVSSSQFEKPPGTLTGVAHKLILGAYKLDDGLLLMLDTDAAINLGQDKLIEPGGQLHNETG